MRREILVAIVAIVMASTAFAQRMLPNSYIEKPTPTLSALIAHVKNNPKVMDRYVRHFQMTPDEVITFLKSLHISKLPKDMYFNVWNVPNSTGELRVRRLLFKKGEKFFFDKNNTPVIAVACGNPIIRTDQADTPRITPSVSTPIGPVEVELPGVAPLNMDMSIMQPATPAMPEVIVDTTPPSSSPSPDVPGSESCSHSSNRPPTRSDRLPEAARGAASRAPRDLQSCVSEKC